jgi:hypothetical protein
VVLVLTELEGMTAPDISVATGVPLNTVYTRCGARASPPKNLSSSTVGARMSASVTVV